MIKLDRVKVINGLCSTKSSNETENVHQLNILNWSKFDNLSTKDLSTIDETKVKDENDPSIIRKSVIYKVESMQKLQQYFNVQAKI